MTPIQALIILAIVILIVWWALRRSAGESTKIAPSDHGPEVHAEHGTHEEHADALKSEMIEPEAPSLAPEPALVQVAERVSEPISVAVPEVEIKPDDLKIIEGIGPKIASVLISHGVKTFTQLAAMKPEEIDGILISVDERLGRLADPSTWPQQAELAARGDLEGLQKLQDNLKGGRIE